MLLVLIVLLYARLTFVFVVDMPPHRSLGAQPRQARLTPCPLLRPLPRGFRQSRIVGAPCPFPPLFPLSPCLVFGRFPSSAWGPSMRRTRREVSHPRGHSPPLCSRSPPWHWVHAHSRNIIHTTKLAESIPTTWSNRKMEARNLLQQV